ncbi:hypothetical protein AX16_010573 [Volvariella volvacea WC 439]|nr:hypothetical protein AX16_010573 [Volvariella volvacea WC 439]
MASLAQQTVTPLPSSSAPGTSTAPVSALAPSFSPDSPPSILLPQGLAQPSTSSSSSTYSSTPPVATGSMVDSSPPDEKQKILAGGTKPAADTENFSSKFPSIFDKASPQGETLVEVYSPATSDSTDSEPLPVRSHLSPVFMNEADDFVKLLSSVFPQADGSAVRKVRKKGSGLVSRSTVPATLQATAQAPPTRLIPSGLVPGACPLQTPVSLQQPQLYGPDITAARLEGSMWEMLGLDTASIPLSFLSMPSLQPALNDVRHLPVQDFASMKMDSLHTFEELQHYLYCFFSIFLKHLPIVHAATFDASKKPPILVSAMQACGALFMRTKKSAQYITKVLAASREILDREFTKQELSPMEQTDLVLAVVLLQTIGLFHQEAEERSTSVYYHSMLVMMIKRAGMMKRNALWKPRALFEVPVEQLWHEWVHHETTKRAILWSYMHDCCHCIYFALQPSYNPIDMDLYLPCDTALWQAQSAEEWLTLLQSSSPFPSIEARLVGESMPLTLNYLMRCQLIPTTIPVPLGPFPHFVLIHAILRELFTVCANSRTTEFLARAALVPAVNDEAMQQIMGLGYSLQNWLHNWTNAPEFPHLRDEEEAPFIANVIPFYWLGQVVLLAYEECFPPFQPHSTISSQVEMRFKLVKQWLKHIRGFLKNSNEAVTLRWSELMKMRLRSWQTELEEDPSDGEDGLLEFFCE